MSCLSSSNRGLRAAVRCGVASLGNKSAYLAGVAQDLQRKGFVVGGAVMGGLGGGFVAAVVTDKIGGVADRDGTIGSGGVFGGVLLGAKAGDIAANALPKNKGGVVGGAIGGAVGGPFGYLTGSRLGNRIGSLRPKTQRPGTPGPGGALYDDQRLNLRAGVALSETFGGGYLTTASLLGAVGDQQQAGQMRPLVKQDGEDDLFTAEGPRGQIAFTLPDGVAGSARIEGIIPARGREVELSDALDGRLPKYVITDDETGDRYATRKPYEARQFSKALNQLPEEAVDELHPGETGFDDDYKNVPEALFY